VPLEAEVLTDAAATAMAAVSWAICADGRKLHKVVVRLRGRKGQVECRKSGRRIECRRNGFIASHRYILVGYRGVKRSVCIAHLCHAGEVFNAVTFYSLRFIVAFLQKVLKFC
jgi:hypothetical protein